MESGETNLVKVFSATLAHGRESLGERITKWLRDNPRITVAKAIVRLSSDREFHCLSIVLVGQEQLAE